MSLIVVETVKLDTGRGFLLVRSKRISTGRISVPAKRCKQAGGTWLHTLPETTSIVELDLENGMILIDKVPVSKK